MEATFSDLHSLHFLSGMCAGPEAGQSPFPPPRKCKHFGTTLPKEKKKSPPRIKKTEYQAVENQRELCVGSLQGEERWGPLQGQASPLPPQWGYQAGMTARWLRGTGRTKSGIAMDSAPGTKMAASLQVGLRLRAGAGGLGSEMKGLNLLPGGPPEQ